MPSPSASPSPSLSFDEIVQAVRAAPHFEFTEKNGGDDNGPLLPDAMKDVFVRMAVIQDSEKPHMKRPRVALFAGDHAVTGGAGQGELAAAAIKPMMEGNDPINRLCFHADAELRVYELDIEHPARDYTSGADSMTQEEALHAMAYGMMAVEPGVDFLVLGGIGQGQEVATKSYIESLEENEDDHNVFTRFCHYGNLPTAACVGALIAARLARVPVLSDNPAVAMALSFLQYLRSDSVNHGFFIDTADNLWQSQFKDVKRVLPIPMGIHNHKTYNAMMILSLWQGYMSFLQPDKGINIHMPV